MLTDTPLHGEWYTAEIWRSVWVSLFKLLFLTHYLPLVLRVKFILYNRRTPRLRLVDESYRRRSPGYYGTGFPSSLCRLHTASQYMCFAPGESSADKWVILSSSVYSRWLYSSVATTLIWRLKPDWMQKEVSHWDSCLLIKYSFHSFPFFFHEQHVSSCCENHEADFYAATHQALLSLWKWLRFLIRNLSDSMKQALSSCQGYMH